MGTKRKLAKRLGEAGNFSCENQDLIAAESGAASTLTGACDGNCPGSLDNQNEQGSKMDITKMKQCRYVLKVLKDHDFGWVFNQPVDPIELKIPDYFSIITKPMDLGTVQYKLERKLYLNTHQFAADVRLTFSNAMRYNPPNNSIHKMAKELNNIFITKWKSLELKWRMESPNSFQPLARKIMTKQIVSSKRFLQRVPSCNSSSLSSKSLSAADKLKLQNSLAKISRQNIPSRLFNFLQNACLLEQSVQDIIVNIDELDNTTLWELHQIVSGCEDAEPTKLAGLMRNSQGLMQGRCKGTGATMVTSGNVNTRACTTSSGSKSSNHCCVTDCPCSHHDDFTEASFNVMSERSSCTQNLASHSTASSLDCGNISGVDGASSGTVDRIDTDFPCIDHLSPTKALRAAMLKSRFADTILKAEQKTLLTHGEKADAARMQREREKLEKRQKEEVARIQAQVRAVEDAVRLKAEELKIQRDREREAARLAVQKMEKTVDIDENSQILKELENLGYSQPLHLDMPDVVAGDFVNTVEQQPVLLNPLARLGLFMKEDDLDEEFDKWISYSGGDMEEGEIGVS